MFILKMVRFLLGYMTILVKGSYCERFLNISSRRGMGFWNIKKLSPKQIQLNLRRNDFEEAKKVADKAGCEIEITKKFGIPHLFSKYKKRKALIFGALFFLVLLYFSTFFVWEIEDVGEAGLNRAVILSSLEEKGVKTGARIASIDIDHIKNEVLIENDEISWIGINIKGTKVVIDARKRDAKPEVLNLSEACDIIAKKPGVIASIEVKAGTAMVKVGDTVSEGQVLISNEVLLGREKGTIYVRAQGDVMARTFYEKEITSSLYEETKIFTGEETSFRVLRIFGREIPLSFRSTSSYEKYDTVREESIVIGDSDILEIQKIGFKEYVTERNEISEEEAIRRGKEKLDLLMLKEKPDAIITNRMIEAVNEENILRVKITYECNEPIGAVIRASEKISVPEVKQ